MRHLTGTVLLMIGLFASGACSSAAATIPATTPATPSTAATPSTVATDRFPGAVDPGMVLSGKEVVTSAEVGAATEAAANGLTAEPEQLP